MMKEQLEAIRKGALEAIAGTKAAAELDALRVKYLGKKGELTAVLKLMGSLSAEERPVMGQLANEVRAAVEKAIESQSAILEKAALEAKLKAETVDVTIPGKEVALGHKHPMYTVLDEIKQVFLDMGFEIMDGPEIELESYNFTKLNAPESHPSRDWTDTFYLTEDSKILLRTQTSPMQIRAMEDHGVPIRMISPGRVYRKDEVDATHSPMFHQIEGHGGGQGRHHGGPEGHTERRHQEPSTAPTPSPGSVPTTSPSPSPPARWTSSATSAAARAAPPARARAGSKLLGAGMVHPKVLRRLRHRPGRVFRLRLRHGSGALRHGPLQDQRPAADLRERRTVPAAVLTILAKMAQPFCANFAECRSALAASGSHVCTLSGVFCAVHAAAKNNYN